MKLYSTIILFASLMYSGVAMGQNDADSLNVSSEQTEMFASTPDTLVDLNKQLNGLKEWTVASSVIVPEAIQITKEGLIILTDSKLKADVYNFEVKATSHENEVYTVNVKITRDGQNVTSTIVADKIDMATGFRKEGKIYVVVAVSLILFSVIVIYLIFLDRRMRKLSSKVENKA